MRQRTPPRLILTSLPPRPDRRRAAATWWHAGWLLVLALASLVLLAARVELSDFALAALVLGAVPAALGLALGRSERFGAQAAMVLAWAAATAAGALLVGGLTGPLAAWCLAPLAAAAASGRIRVAALGGASAVAAVGIAALGALAWPLPLPDPWPDYWLRLLAFLSVALGLGAGLVLLLRGVADEIHRRALAEAELKALLQDQPFLLLMLNAGGQVRGMWGPPPPGVSLERLSENLLSTAAAPADRGRVEDAIRRARAEGSAELRFAPAGDPDKTVWLVLRRARASRLVAALRDATAQISRERELEQARAEAEAQNAGKSRFLANMSHELRTPLNAIMGFSDIMRSRLFGPLPDKYGEYAELIHESGGHLLDLINDVLDMSKIEADRYELAREVFDAREAVSAVLRLMRGQADRAGVQLRGALPREPVSIDADRRALKQIAFNLISNALKFTPRDGSVTVTLQARGPELELVVADSGVGIRPEDLQRIGRPYEQAGDADRRAAGTGLGLSLVRALSELHGGALAIDSRVGEGTTATVRLPVVQTAAQNPTAPTAPIRQAAL